MNERMKIALVGVGPWGSLLARKLTEAGAHIAFYVRHNGPDVEGLGRRVALDELWPLCQPGQGGEPPAVDGLVIAAPPDVTLALAQRAAASGIAVLATKPLQLTAPMAITAPFFVDYVRLWAKCYGLLKAHVAGHAIQQVRVEFYGKGPWRDFSSLDDYGAHAFAFVHDLLGCEHGLSDVIANPVRHFERGATLHAATARLGDAGVAIEVGNGAEFKRLRLVVEAEGVGSAVYEEVGTEASFSVNDVTILAEKQDPLGTMAAQFIEQQQQGLADTRFIALSVAVTHSLRLVHEAEARL